MEEEAAVEAIVLVSPCEPPLAEDLQNAVLYRNACARPGPITILPACADLAVDAALAPEFRFLLAELAVAQQSSTLQLVVGDKEAARGCTLQALYTLISTSGARTVHVLLANSLHSLVRSVGGVHECMLENLKSAFVDAVDPAQEGAAPGITVSVVELASNAAALPHHDVRWSGTPASVTGLARLSRHASGGAGTVVPWRQLKRASSLDSVLTRLTSTGSAGSEGNPPSSSPPFSARSSKVSVDGASVAAAVGAGQLEGAFSVAAAAAGAPCSCRSRIAPPPPRVGLSPQLHGALHETSSFGRVRAALSRGDVAACRTLVPPLVLSAAQRYGLFGLPIGGGCGDGGGPWPFTGVAGWYMCGQPPDGMWRLDAAAAALPAALHAHIDAVIATPAAAADSGVGRAEPALLCSEAAEAAEAEPAQPLPQTPRREWQRHVAILGGSFSPVTQGHIGVAAQVAAALARRGRRACRASTATDAAAAADATAGHEDDERPDASAPAIDELWVVPCGARPDKPSLGVSPWHRYAMCVLAVEECFPPPPASFGVVDGSTLPVRVMPLELWERAAVPTYALLTGLGRAFPHVRFSVVVGADLLPSLPAWRHAQALLRECSFLVVPRPSYPAPQLRSGSGGGHTAASSSSPVCTPQRRRPSSLREEAEEEGPQGEEEPRVSPLHAWLVCHADGAPLLTPDISSTLLRDAIGHAAVRRGGGGTVVASAVEPWSAVDTLTAASVVGYMRAKGLYAPPPPAPPLTAAAASAAAAAAEGLAMGLAAVLNVLKA